MANPESLKQIIKLFHLKSDNTTALEQEEKIISHFLNEIRQSGKNIIIKDYLRAFCGSHFDPDASVLIIYEEDNLMKVKTFNKLSFLLDIKAVEKLQQNIDDFLNKHLDIQIISVNLSGNCGKPGGDAILDLLWIETS